MVGRWWVIGHFRGWRHRVLERERGARRVQRRALLRIVADRQMDLDDVALVRGPGQKERVSPTNDVLPQEAMQRVGIDAPTLDRLIAGLRSRIVEEVDLNGAVADERLVDFG